MRKAAFAFGSLLAFLALIVPALALNITVSVDKRVVSPGENFTISGTIANDTGATSVYTYRASAVGPNKTIICDSGRQQTASDGKFSLVCTAPTRDKSVKIGIHNADKRAVIPLAVGVAVNDSAAKKIERAKGTVHVVFKTDLDKRLNALAKEIDDFVARAKRFSEKCENIPAAVQQAANVNVKETCAQVRKVADDQTQKSTALRTRAQSIVSQNATSENIAGLTERVKDFRDNFKKYSGEIDQAKRIVSDVKSKIPGSSGGRGK